MRFSRWLILAALLSIVAFVMQTYVKRQQALARDKPVAPPPLENGIDGRARDWVYTQSDGERPRVTVRAKSFRQVKSPSVMELSGVELQLFHKEGDQFDLVRSAKAQFDIAAKTLYSDGDVDIIMGKPAAQGKPNAAGKPDAPAHRGKPNEGTLPGSHASGGKPATAALPGAQPTPITNGSAALMPARSVAGSDDPSPDDSAGGRIVKIHTSGVRFSSDTGKASTDRAAKFEFEQGYGSASGIDYDPMTRELHLRSNVNLHWKGKGKGTKPMLIEAGEAFYREAQSKVFLLPWSKLTRDTLHMEGAASEVTLDHGNIKEAVSQTAHGVADDPGRKLEFSADSLVLGFGDDTAIQNIKGQQNARLVSTANSMRTTVTGELINLEFDPAAAQSTLKRALAMKKAVAEAHPSPRPGEPLAETRVLRSEVIHLNMREGGREIETVETDGPGTVDFLPNRADQSKRSIKGDRIWMAYGPENRIQTFRTINAFTRTDKPGTPPPPAMLTQSKELLATFDPKTSELARLEQKTDFRYEEGTRRATADRATLEQAKDRITLEGSARAADPTGSAAADRLVMDQATGDFVADGRVATTRLPDQKASSSALLSGADVMQGRAQHVTSSENNQKLHYEGNAVVWQGANRVEADRIDIDRMRQVFEAHGQVVSQFADKAAPVKTGEEKPAATSAAAPGGAAGLPNAARLGSAAEKVVASKTTATQSAALQAIAIPAGALATQPGGARPVATQPKPAAAPVFTVVRAPDLTYTDETRLADYQGGAVMVRPGLTVSGKELKAYLNDSGSSTSLDKAFADGGVKIVSVEGKRTRTGTAEHGEYYTAEQKVILQDGDPLLVDNLKGQTRGKQLTWWANNDRLLVNGVENRPADTLLRKK